MVTVLSLPPQPRLLDVHALADLYGAQVERRWQAKESGRAPGPGLCFPRLAQALGSWMPSLGGWLEPGIIVIHGQPGSGKALDNETLAMTPTGSTPIGKIRIGDKVIGRNGEPTTVWGVFPQGVRPAYLVTFTDDTAVVCDAEHLWGVSSKNRGYEVLPLSEILERGLRRVDARQQDHRSAQFAVPTLTAPVQFVERDDLPLHPYVLGVLLGDGGLTQGTPRLSSVDDEILDRVREWLPVGVGLEKDRYSQCDYRITTRRGDNNPVTDALRSLGLMGHRSEHKFVPEAYRYAAPDTRLLLLQGLMDTDGSVTKAGEAHCAVEFSSSSRPLAEGFLFLLRSLGGSGRIKNKATKKLPHYRISAAFPNGLNPFLLSRKAERVTPRVKYLPGKRMVSAEEVTPREMTCIRVEAADGLFVLADSTVTHNTALAHQISASCGQPALYLSADMPLVGLLRRHVARQTCQPKIGLLTGRVSPDQEYQMVIDALALTPDWAVVDGRTVPVEMEWLALALREHRGRHPSSMLVIDSLHAWAASLAAPDMSEYESLNAAVDAIKSLVEALDLPVIVLSERNRESAKSGGLGASRGSGRIEFAADVVIDLSVEDTEGQWSSRDVTLKLCKNRDGMAGHKIRYGFNGDTQTFSEWEHANDRS